MSVANKLGHWIQVSGATVLSIPDIANGTFGEKRDKVFSDVDGADEVRHLIQQNSGKRVVDNMLLNMASPKTALVFPPIIYGQGRGPVKQRSVQIPELCRVAIQTRKAVQVEKGESAWSNVHISDISQIFVRLVEKAVQGEDGDIWNRNGLYFAGNAMLVSKSIRISTIANGIRTSSKSLNSSHRQAIARAWWIRNQSRKSVTPRQTAYLRMLEFSGVPTPARARSALANFLDGFQREERWKRKSR